MDYVKSLAERLGKNQSQEEDDIRKKLSLAREKYTQEGIEEEKNRAERLQSKTSSGTTTTASSPVNNSAYNSMSYEEKKDYLKDEKSDALKEKLSAGASKIASFFSSDDEKKELANSRYEQSSSEYDKYKNALDLLKQNKWEETQKDNTVLLDSNTEVQQLVKLMYDTEKQTQTVQRQSSATFSNNPLMMITSSESMDSQQKQVIENEKIISEAQNKLKEMGYDAYSLLDTYKRNINAEQAQVIDKQVAEIANEKPILANAVSVGLNSMQATALPDMIVNTIQELQTGDYRPLDTNSLAFAPTRAMNTIRETTSKNIQKDYDSEFGKNTADFLYQTGMSMADSLSTMPLTVVPGARSAVIGASAMTQGVVDSTDRGVSSTDALLTGLAQGTSEVVFEALSLGNLKTLKSSGKTGVKNFVKDVLKQSFVEGSEETATEISNIITDKIINDDKSSIDQTYNSYIEAGYSEEEAKQQTAKDTALQVLQAFAGGAISGGVFGAGASTINSVNMNNAYRSQGEAIKNADQVSQLVNKGLEQDTSSPAYKIAMQMLTNDEVADAYTTPTNENVSSKKLGQLNQEVVKENDISAFSTLVKGEKEAQTLTESFTKLINDENLSRKEINTLMTNETSRKALSQLTNIDAISNENKKMSNSKLAENLATDYRNTSMLKLDYLQRPTEYATTKSGQTVILDGIEENKNGNITVKTLDNQVLNLDEINVQNDDTKQLLDYSKTLDDKTSKAFVEGYNYHKYNGTVNDYFAGTQEIIKAQVQGKSFDEAYSIANNVSSITKEQAEHIYFNSVLDQMVKNAVRQKNNANIINQKKKAEFVNAISSKVKPGTTVLAQNLNDYEKSEVKVIEKIAKKYGREVVIVDDTEELGYASSNGLYKNGKIVLAANNEAGIMSAYFGHELFHDLKKNSPQMAQELQDFVISTLKEQTSYNYEQRFEELKELYRDEIDGLSDKETTDFINEEITANACFTVFTNEDNVNRLVKENKTLAEKIRDFFINFRKTIENALVKLSKSNKEYDALQGLDETVDKIAQMFDAALNEEQKNHTTDSGSAQYALKELFNSNYDFSENIIKVSKMTPVAKLNGNEFEKGNVDLVTQVTEYFKSIGNQVNSKYGTVTLNRTGVKSSVSHGIGRNKAVAFKSVPGVIERGFIIDYKENYKGRNYDTAVFAAPITINNIGYYLAVVVNVNKNSNEYYLHEVAIQRKKEDKTLFKTGNSKNATPSNASSSIISLLNKLQNVNSDSTQDEKLKFSLKESVEETDKLLAVHNTSEDKLIKTLELGGFPMPSIAIMKANMAGSQGFGDITIVFNKETIDPRKRENKVYSADAYTPTKVNIESKLDTDKVNDLYFKAIDYENANRNIPFALKSIRLEKGNLADRINGSSSFESFMKNLENDYEMKQFFLSESDNQVKEYVQKETRTEVSDADAELYDYLNDKMKDYEFVLSPKLFKERYEALFDKHYSEYFKDKFNFSTEKIENILNNMNLFDKRILLDKARRYRINGKETVKVEDDIKATEQKIDERINGNDYKKWLYNLFDGIVEKQGIQRENVDPYTSRGDRKSFEQLHYDVTLENIVKAMKEQQTQGKALFGNSLYGSVQTEYSTISEIKDNSDRLQDINQDDFDNQRKEFRARFYEIADSMSKNDNNTSVEDLLCEAVMVSKTKSGMANYIEKEGKGWINFKESAVDDLINLVSDIRQMPTRYFEAKPQRAVKFNEIAKVVLPDNASTELKTALNDNNVDYIEYSAGDESARIEAINSLDEAKFSKKESNTNYEDLLRENEELSELNENLQRMLELVSSENNELREQFKIKTVRTQKESSVNKVSAYLRKQYESNYDKSTLTSRLANLYDYITNAGENVDSDYIWNVSKDIATDLLSDTQIKDTTVYDENKELRDYIRKTTIQVPENVRNDMAEYNDFRKRNFGTMRLSNDKGTPLDTIYSELSNINPAYFPADAVLSEQLEHIENFFNSTEIVYYNGAEMIAEEYGLSLDEYSNIVASDIFDQYFNVPEVQSFVSEKNQEEMELLHQEYKAQLEDVRKLYRERYEEQLRLLREENQQRLEKLKDKNDKTIAKLNERHLDQIAKQKAHFKDVSKRGTQRRNASKLRESIRRSLKKIAKLGAEPDKKKHIPNSILESVNELINAINLTDTQKDTAIKDVIGKFRLGFADTLSENKSAEYQELSEVYNYLIKDELTELYDNIGDKTIKQMNSTELKQLNDILKITLRTINNINKAFNRGINDNIVSYANKTKNEFLKQKKSVIYKGGAKDLFVNSLKPEYFFEYLGSDTLLELYHDLRKGEDVWMTNINNAFNIANGIRKKYGWDKWEDQKVTFKTSYGDAIELSLQERLGVFANSLREQTKNHLLGGGITLQNQERTKAEKVKDFVKSKDKKSSLKKILKESNDYSSHQLSDDDLTNIIATLTPEQINYVKDMIQYLSTDVAKLGNEITRALYDVEFFTEKNYYPAIVNKDNTKQSATELKGSKRMKYGSFTHRTKQDASEPIILKDFDGVWAEHVDAMAKYHAFVLPLENFDRVYHYYEHDVEKKYDNIKSKIMDAYGEQATKYIDKFLDDINGNIVGNKETKLVNKWISRFKKGATFASMSVVVQQPSALARALSEIDVKYLAKATGKGFSKNAYNEMMNYSPIANIKKMGYFDTNLSQTAVEYLNNKSYDKLKDKLRAFVTDGKYRDDALSFLAVKADEITWTHLWNAVKFEIKDNNKSISNEDLLQLTNERFTEIVTKTQVYDSVFSRNALMRANDSLLKSATAFMSEPTVSLNMLANAFIQTHRGKMSKKQGARVIGALVATSAINSILQSIITSARDIEPDDDREWAEIYLAQLVPNFLSNLNPLNQIAFIRDVISIFSGYDITRADMNAISDLIKSFKNLDSETKSDYEKFSSIAKSLSVVTGIPVKNIMRDLEATFNTTKSIFNGTDIEGSEIRELYKEEINNFLGWEWFKPEYDKAVKAIKKGEYEGYEKYAETVYASSQAYNLLYEVLKKYGYNSLEYKKAEELCIDVKKDNGTENPNPLSSMKDRAIEDYYTEKNKTKDEGGSYDKTNPYREICLDLYDRNMDKVNEALEKYEKGNAE